MEVSGQIHAPVILLTEKEPPAIHLIGDWVSCIADVEAAAKRIFPFPFRESNPGRPAPSPVTTLNELQFVLILWNFWRITFLRFSHFRN
jgi:hypothetical protein